MMKRIMLVLCLAGMLFLVACGSGINWQERVGSYTYAQAVEDLGEPRSREATLAGDTRYYWYDSVGREWDDVHILLFDQDNVLKEVERADY